MSIITQSLSAYPKKTADGHYMEKDDLTKEIFQALKHANIHPDTILGRLIKTRLDKIGTMSEDDANFAYAQLIEATVASCFKDMEVVDVQALDSMKNAFIGELKDFKSQKIIKTTSIWGSCFGLGGYQRNFQFELCYQNIEGLRKAKSFDLSLDLFGLGLQHGYTNDTIYFSGTNFDFYDSNRHFSLGHGIAIGNVTVAFLLVMAFYKIYTKGERTLKGDFTNIFLHWYKTLFVGGDDIPSIEKDNVLMKFLLIGKSFYRKLMRNRYYNQQTVIASSISQALQEIDQAVAQEQQRNGLQVGQQQALLTAVAAQPAGGDIAEKRRELWEKMEKNPWPILDQQPLYATACQITPVDQTLVTVLLPVIALCIAYCNIPSITIVPFKNAPGRLIILSYPRATLVPWRLPTWHGLHLVTGGVLRPAQQQPVMAKQGLVALGMKQ